MRRRDLIKGIAGSAAAWPFVAHAQQPATPIVGFLRSTSRAPFQNLVVAFGQGLKEAGFAVRTSQSNIAMRTIKSIGCRLLWQT
jgi:hypothetical protein